MVQNDIVSQQTSEARPIPRQETVKAATFIKVAATSRTTAVAGAIAGAIRHYHYAEVQAIGAGATNQAMKAITIARTFVQQDAIDLICIPYFVDITLEERECTAMRFRVEART